MTTHVLYIDDSGTKEYSKTGQSYGKGVSKYFVLGGVLITPANAGILSSKIVEHKLNCFGVDTVEIKSVWLRNPKDRKEKYLEPFDISEKALYDFVENFYDAIIATDLNFIASVVDKQQVETAYKYPWYPPAIAYEILLQRAEQELHGIGDASVIIDDMTGKTPHGNPYKDNLLKQHEELKQKGSKLQRGISFCCIKGRLKFVNSSHSHLIQVADSIAYDVYRQFRDYGNEWEQIGLKVLPTYEYFIRIVNKFRKGPNGIITGYGIAKFPLRHRIPWVPKLKSAVP